MAKLHYRDLVVWQRAIDLVPRIYAATRNLPIEERYALGDQLRRAAVSVLQISPRAKRGGIRRNFSRT